MEASLKLRPKLFARLSGLFWLNPVQIFLDAEQWHFNGFHKYCNNSRQKILLFFILNIFPPFSPFVKLIILELYIFCALFLKCFDKLICIQCFETPKYLAFERFLVLNRNAYKDTKSIP